MTHKFKLSALLIAASSSMVLFPEVSAQEEFQNDQTIEITQEEIEQAQQNVPESVLNVSEEPILSMPDTIPEKFTYDSGVDIAYPENGVKGIYVTSNSAGGEKFDELTNLVNTTALNSMVIDVKEDYGSVTMPLESGDELIEEATVPVTNPNELMPVLEENQIYPIARIVVFKDSRLAEQRPDLAFKNPDGTVWKNSSGESFVNPYEKEVWEYNVEIAKQAAKLGFKEIQFDYVRFPEGFETRDDELQYSFGEYEGSDLSNVETRVQAVTDFVEYAHKELAPYGVDVAADIFGYTAMVREAPGIGQSFPKIAENVDVISSMIYPSHWGPGNLGVAKPDTEPYKTIDNYMQMELDILNDLGEDAPQTRPWLQDFTASYLGAGNYIEYGPEEVSAQIKALHDNGINEYLLWDASNNYSPDATYSYQEEDSE